MVGTANFQILWYGTVYLVRCLEGVGEEVEQSVARQSSDRHGHQELKERLVKDHLNQRYEQHAQHPAQ